jgi:hypothetical protein
MTITVKTLAQRHYLDLLRYHETLVKRWIISIYMIKPEGFHEQRIRGSVKNRFPGLGKSWENRGRIKDCHNADLKMFQGGLSYRKDVESHFKEEPMVQDVATVENKSGPAHGVQNPRIIQFFILVPLR